MRDAIVAALREQGIDARPAPPTGLRALAALVRDVALFVGGDTGPTHMAAMQGVPTVGVFGASDALRNGPWGPRATSVQLTDADAEGLPCVPCWKRECRLPRDGKEITPCLKRLTPDRVVRAAVELLRDSKSGSRK
jgi:ADP-heptose:LPS heptosyltransferase